MNLFLEHLNLSSLLLNILYLLLIATVLDTLVRAAFAHSLQKKVLKKGDYRKRHLKIGTGKKHITITLLGDSIMYGEGSDVDVSVVGNLVEDFISQGYSVNLNNLATSNHTVGDVAHKQVPLLEKSDFVFVYVGANNYFQFHSTNRYHNELFELGKALRGKRVIWITIGDPRFLWLVPLWLRWIFHFRAKTFSKLLRNMVAKNSSEAWYVIDAFSIAFAEMKKQKKTPKQILSEGIHLSHEGQKFFSDIINEGFTKLKIQI